MEQHRSQAIDARTKLRGRALLLVALAACEAGCMGSVRIGPDELARPGHPEARAVLTLRDSTRVEVSRPRLVGRVIRGVVSSCNGSSCDEVSSAGQVQLRDVDTIDVERIDTGVTLGALLGVAVIAGLIAVVVSSLDFRWGGSSPAGNGRLSWCAHRVLWDLIPVALRPETEATRTDILHAVVALRWARLREQRSTAWADARAAQVEQEALCASLNACCTNLDEVIAASTSLIEHPRRSSSLVEALNSRLRVLQMVHRNVSDNLLALVALAWNLSPKREGKRRGPSPYAQLGIDFADDARPWHQILLEQMDAN